MYDYFINLLFLLFYNTIFIQILIKNLFIQKVGFPFYYVFLFYNRTVRIIQIYNFELKFTFKTLSDEKYIIS